MMLMKRRMGEHMVVRCWWGKKRASQLVSSLLLVLSIVRYPFCCCNNKFAWMKDHYGLASWVVVMMLRLYLYSHWDRPLLSFLVNTIWHCKMNWFFPFETLAWSIGLLRWVDCSNMYGQKQGQQQHSILTTKTKHRG